jgi:hypothetical protein
MMHDRASFATEDSLAFDEGTVAEGAEALLWWQESYPGRVSVSGAARGIINPGAGAT